MKGTIFAQNRGVSRTVVERQDETDCKVNVEPEMHLQMDLF